MTKQIHLNAFVSACPSPMFWGGWMHAGDESARGFSNLDYWIKLAKTLERGCFDALFIADTIGISDAYGGNEDAMLRNGVFFPSLDPVTLVPAIASHTEKLGFAVTYTTSYSQPYLTARLFSSLDHLTQGRVAWNIVTTASKVGEANGLSPEIEHDTRYDQADEYMEVCYKLWEQSWSDDAYVLDPESRVVTDPDKVHRINHTGEHFSVRGPHQISPSPQRTPFLYQAGASPRGTAFAGRHAEAVFLPQNTPEKIRDYVKRVKDHAADNGRDPDHLKVLMAFRCLVGESEQDAQNRFDDMMAVASGEGSLAMFAHWTGNDIGSLPDDLKLADLETNDKMSVGGSSGLVENKGDATVGDLKAAIAKNGNAIKYVGSPAHLADQMEELMDCGLDGFNIVTGPVPLGHEAIVDFLVPELQKRGLFRKQYEESILRERYLGPGIQRLPDGHPGKSDPIS